MYHEPSSSNANLAYDHGGNVVQDGTPGRVAMVCAVCFAAALALSGCHAEHAPLSQGPLTISYDDKFIVIDGSSAAEDALVRRIPIIVRNTSDSRCAVSVGAASCGCLGIEASGLAGLASGALHKGDMVHIEARSELRLVAVINRDRREGNHRVSIALHAKDNMQKNYDYDLVLGYKVVEFAKMQPPSIHAEIGDDSSSPVLWQGRLQVATRQLEGPPPKISFKNVPGFVKFTCNESNHEDDINSNYRINFYDISALIDSGRVVPGHNMIHVEIDGQASTSLPVPLTLSRRGQVETIPASLNFYVRLDESASSMKRLVVRSPDRKNFKIDGILVHGSPDIKVEFDETLENNTHFVNVRFSPRMSGEVKAKIIININKSKSATVEIVGICK